MISGHPFWPAQVVSPVGTGLSSKKGQVIVKFYGTNDYASVKVSPEYLKSYDEFKDQKPRKKRNKNFLKAVKQIERAMKVLFLFSEHYHGFRGRRSIFYIKARL